MKKICVAISCIFALSLSSYGLAAKPDNPGNGNGNGNGNKEKRGNAGKIAICHNGSSYNVETMEEERISFVINTSRNALKAHINNHGDCDQVFEEGEPVQECELQDDGLMVVCEEKVSCTCVDPDDPELPE